MTQKEQKAQHAKGIFTVNQLSYTFRPRKSSPKSFAKPQHALKALAIRKNQIHILGTPVLNIPRTQVYLDVEGDLDRDFYYLIGLRAESNGSFIQSPFGLMIRLLRVKCGLVALGLFWPSKNPGSSIMEVMRRGF
jgi:hypothetical protein